MLRKLEGKDRDKKKNYKKRNNLSKKPHSYLKRPSQKEEIKKIQLKENLWEKLKKETIVR
ncbi:hypothetical protein HIR72_02555 [Pasteurella multocida]|uniref:hypothetical protein n=1 Tax=Pasteurella multocida TaxID=747 RepID=UPI00146140F4|nr:hypothetical protein [Pasteurella multocida]NMR59565.1 hypothetical protein [Pasteurella multocida]